MKTQTLKELFKNKKYEYTDYEEIEIMDRDYTIHYYYTIFFNEEKNIFEEERKDSLRKNYYIREISEEEIIETILQTSNVLKDINPIKYEYTEDENKEDERDF